MSIKELYDDIVEQDTIIGILNKKLRVSYNKLIKAFCEKYEFEYFYDYDKVAVNYNNKVITVVYPESEEEDYSDFYTELSCKTNDIALDNELLLYELTTTLVIIDKVEFNFDKETNIITVK